MMKDVYVSSLQQEMLGEEFESLFLLKDAKLSKNVSTTWCNLILFDKTGEIPGICFGEDAVNAEKLKGKIVFVRGMAAPHNGSMQVKIKSLRLSEQKPDLSDFVPGLTEEQKNALWNRLCVLIEGITDNCLKTLLNAVFQSYGKAYLSLPGGYRHHMFAGGLLAHTVEVAELTDLICRQKGAWYPGATSVDREIAVAGALLHDIGKCLEFKPFPFGEKREDAPYLNYKVRGSFMVSQVIMNVASAYPQGSAEVKRFRELMPILSNEAFTCHRKNEEPPRDKESRTIRNADLVSADSDACDYEESKLLAERPEGGFFYSQYFGCNMLAAGKEVS